MSADTGSILAAYRREVTDAKRWLQTHRQQCPQCATALRTRPNGLLCATGRPNGLLCATGRRIQRYVTMNEEIVGKLAATPGGETIQGTLW